MSGLLIIHSGCQVGEQLDCDVGLLSKELQTEKSIIN